MVTTDYGFFKGSTELYMKTVMKTEVTESEVQKVIFSVFGVSNIRYDSSLNALSRKHGGFHYFQGDDCFHLGHLLRDESWRIAVTRKTLKMSFCTFYSVV